MLLCDITIGSTVHYLSTEYVDEPARLSHVYLPHVASVDDFRFATRKQWGGYAAPSYGSMVLLPKVFASNWPPPESCAITISYLPDNASVTTADPLFAGVISLRDITASGVTYDLHDSGYSTMESDAVYSGTVNSVFADVCSTLGLTLDTTYSYTPSPGVDYVASGEQLLIENLSDIAASTSQRFYITPAGVLHLVACGLDNGATIAINDTDFEYCSWAAAPPVRRFVATNNPTAITNIQMHVRDVDNASNVAVVAAAHISTSSGGPLVTPAVGVSAYEPGYPSTNLTDGNAATYWRSPNGGVPGVVVGMGALSGALIEYAITAGPTGYQGYTPSVWDLYGYCPHRMEHHFITRVESTGWPTAGEQRRFQFPVGFSWLMSIPGTAGYGDEVNIDPLAFPAYGDAVLAWLAVIKTIYEKPRFSARWPMGDALPKIGQRINILDESMLQPLEAYFRVAEIVYDFNKHMIVASGEGAWV